MVDRHGGAAVVRPRRAATDLLPPARADGVHAVDVYVAPVKLEDGLILPGNLREMIRLRGPTIDLPITFGI